jgi:hypothetical protein
LNLKQGQLTRVRTVCNCEVIASNYPSQAAFTYFYLALALAKAGTPHRGWISVADRAEDFSQIIWHFNNKCDISVFQIARGGFG